MAAKKKAEAPKKAADLRKMAESLAPHVFAKIVQTAMGDGSSIAAMQARKAVLDMAGGTATNDYTIDLQFIEIEQDDEGHIVTVTRPAAPPMDNSGPLRAVAKTEKREEPKPTASPTPSGDPFKSGIGPV
ncbi:MAG TPA: hypothetical protein VGP72_10420 [Planctomycetota bacterium]|jgi:hypothetical protein